MWDEFTPWRMALHANCAASAISSTRHSSSSCCAGVGDPCSGISVLPPDGLDPGRACPRRHVLPAAAGLDDPVVDGALSARAHGHDLVVGAGVALLRPDYAVGRLA